MDRNQALKIVGACVEHVMYLEGAGDEPPASLAEYSLRELLEANEMIAADSLERTEAGSTTVHVHCDPRLVAALYVAYHYEPEDPPRAIIAAKDGAMVVVVRPHSYTVSAHLMMIYDVLNIHNRTQLALLVRCRSSEVCVEDQDRPVRARREQPCNG
jgi:hypothetical protein